MRTPALLLLAALAPLLGGCQIAIRASGWMIAGDPASVTAVEGSNLNDVRPAGFPVPGARFQVLKKSDGAWVRLKPIQGEETTDGYGRFDAGYLKDPRARYFLVVEKEGYQPLSSEITSVKLEEALQTRRHLIIRLARLPSSETR